MAGRLPKTLIASVAAAALLTLPAGAQGEAFKPNKKSDHAPNGCTKKDCTLREAVIDANATPEKDSITLSKGKPWKVKRTGTNEDAAADGDLDVTADLKVRGKPKATVAGATEEAVFQVPSASTAALKIKKLKVTGGASSGVSASGGSLAIKSSTITKNVSNDAIGGGVDVNVPATATISRSTISKNKSGAGGGISAGGMTTITDSTIAQNTSTGTGGGIKGQASLGLTVRNSTIANNKAQTDGGGISVATGNATLNNVTIARNRADTDGSGGGDVAGGISAAGVVNIANSIIALNTVGGEPLPIADDNCDGTFASGGGNLRETDQLGCMGFMGTDDTVDDDPRLGSLAKNGGLTKTIALQGGSPAIGLGLASAEPRDQRGEVRDNNPDAGAFER